MESNDFLALSGKKIKKKKKTENYIITMLTCNHEGTLLRYPVAITTASMSKHSPLTSSTFLGWNLLIPGTTLIPPDLIFSSVPMSRTGVFPTLFLSCRGPTSGRCRPYFSKFPRTNHATNSSSMSTSHSGSHFNSSTAISNVDLPSTSLGNT